MNKLNVLSIVFIIASILSFTYSLSLSNSAKKKVLGIKETALPSIPNVEASEKKN